MAKDDSFLANLDEEAILFHELCNSLMIASSLVDIMISNPKIEKLQDVQKSLKQMEITIDKLKVAKTSKA